MQSFCYEICFHSCANKTNFHIKSFALSLAFVMRFTAARKWPIPAVCKRSISFNALFLKNERGDFGANTRRLGIVDIREMKH